MKHRTHGYRPVPVPDAYRNALFAGPTCPTCAHRSCRARRAERQPRLGGLRAEFVAEHATAALCQARNPHVLTWCGEATQSYWLATSSGLIEAEDTEALFWLINTASQLPDEADLKVPKVSA